MKLNYRKYGQGKPVLIILHGLFGSLDNWHSLAQRFGEELTVYTVDQRNHGKSPHSNDLTYELMAEDLLEFLNTHNISSAVVMGHSMGGKTVMRFALDYPERAEKLIVVDMPPTKNEASHQTIFKGLKAVKPETLNSRAAADEKLAKYVPEQEVRLFLLKNLTRNEKGAYKWKMNLVAIEENYKNILAAISGEGKKYQKSAFFIYGERSNYIEIERDEVVIKNLFPFAEFQEIKNAGHWIHAEQPVLFFQAVNNILGNNKAGV